MGEERDVYRVSVGKPKGNKPLGRPRRRREDNIRLDLRKWDVGLWTGLGWPRIDSWQALVNAVIKLRVP
jgi:hypothetical protein